MNRLAKRVERLEKTQGVGNEELIIVDKIIDMDGSVVEVIPWGERFGEFSGQSMSPAEFDSLRGNPSERRQTK